MDQVKFVEMPYHFKFCKSCLPKILLGPFLNTLTHMNKVQLKVSWNIENSVDIFNFTRLR